MFDLGCGALDYFTIVPATAGGARTVDSGHFRRFTAAECCAPD